MYCCSLASTACTRSISPTARKASTASTAARPTAPALGALVRHGVNYLQAQTSSPSDSFPGLAAIVTGSNPRTAGMYCDVSYDRKLSPPYATTPTASLAVPASARASTAHRFPRASARTFRRSAWARNWSKSPFPPPAATSTHSELPLLVAERSLVCRFIHWKVRQ
jgi:Type I phosphodiesterase / nucleotide pyrophosphatase